MKEYVIVLASRSYCHVKHKIGQLNVVVWLSCCELDSVLKLGKGYLVQGPDGWRIAKAGDEIASLNLWFLRWLYLIVVINRDWRILVIQKYRVLFKPYRRCSHKPFDRNRSKTLTESILHVHFEYVLSRMWFEIQLSVNVESERFLKIYFRNTVNDDWVLYLIKVGGLN